MPGLERLLYASTATGRTDSLLNMATMPHWLIEGNILYGFICGYTVYLLLGPAAVRRV